MPQITEASLARARAVHRGPGIVGCVVCGHPAARISTTRRPGSLTIRCFSCGLRAWTSMQGSAWWAGRGLRLLKWPLDRLQKEVAQNDQWGSVLPWRVDVWPIATTASGVSRPRCPSSLSCFACGNPHTGQAFLDKHGRPYVRCEVCSNRLFTYRTDSQRRWMGLMAWNATEAGLAEWVSDFLLGEAHLRGLLLNAGAARAATKGDVHVEATG
jgi:transcription elongation factor Elf1